MIVRHLAPALLFGFAAAALAAQSPATTASALPDLGEPAAVPEGAPPHLALVTRQLLQRHAYWLADDARQGRYTGSAQQLATAKYVADQFAKLGLKPLGDKKGFLQTYPLDAVVLDPSTSLLLGDQKVTDVAVLAGPDTKVTLAGKFAFCGLGRADEIPDALAGKIPVVVYQKAPRGGGPGADMQAIQRYFDLARQLAKSSATAGVVVLLGDPATLGNALNYRGLAPDHQLIGGGVGGPREAPSVPLLVVGGTAGNGVLQYLGITVAADGTLTPPPADSKAAGKVQIVTKKNPKATACNVAALLEGTSRKAEAIVFSAHHDHVGRRVDGDAFNGADDNASGTAGLLTIAEAIAKGGERPTRSIIFLSVSGEELGMLGSKHYCSQPTWPLDKIVADINIDMIGRAEADGQQTKIQITPSREHPKYSSLGRLAASLAPKLAITFTSGDIYYERSDHFSFAQKGIPVVFLCDGEHPDYHQVSDSADRLDYVRMEAIARLLCWTGLEVGKQKERPKELGKQDQW